MESQLEQQNSITRTTEDDDNIQDGGQVVDERVDSLSTEDQSVETEDCSTPSAQLTAVANGYSNQNQSKQDKDADTDATTPSSLNMVSPINMQNGMTVYGMPDFSQLNLAAELCAEIKTRLPPPEDDEKILTDDLLQFLEGKVLYHDKLENTIQIQANSMLHCNCNHCIYHHTDVMPPSQLNRHLGHTVTSFKLMVKQSLGDGILLGDMLKIINTELIDTHIGHCCRCRMGRIDEKLIQCNGCPLSYHSFCVGLQKLPELEWYCPKCIQFGRGGKKRVIHNQTQQKLLQNSQKAKSVGQGGVPRVPKRRADSGRITPQNVSGGKQVNRTQTMTGNKFKNQRLFSKEAGLLQDGQEVWYRSNRENILRGNVVLSGDVRGICCSCCSQVVSMSTFEKHAGFGHRRAPYDCVYILNGPNLKELAQKLPQDESLDFVLSRRRRRQVIPPRRRTTTTAKSSSSQNKSKKIDGRTKLIFKRFENIIHELEKCPTGCYICHKEDFDAEFSDITMIICDQCEREFHIGCLRSEEICDLQSLPKGSWFCSKECRSVNDGLREKLEEDEIEVNENYQVRFMRGTREDNNQQSPLFSQACALELIRESFDPIKDGVTGTDLLPFMVKSDVTEDGVWDFAGMCTLLLKFNYKIVGAATFRIFGNVAGEIPLVAVKSSERGRGHCRVIINIIQQLFQDLNVQVMVLPAAQTTLNMWRNKFGCRPLGASRAKELRNFAKYMCFPDCTMVYKYLNNDEEFVEHGDEDISDILHMSDQKVKELEQQFKEMEEAKKKEEEKEEKQKKSGTVEKAKKSGAVEKQQLNKLNEPEKQISKPDLIEKTPNKMQSCVNAEKQLEFSEKTPAPISQENYQESCVFEESQIKHESLLNFPDKSPIQQESQVDFQKDIQIQQQEQTPIQLRNFSLEVDNLTKLSKEEEEFSKVNNVVKKCKMKFVDPEEQLQQMSQPKKKVRKVEKASIQHKNQIRDEFQFETPEAYLQKHPLNQNETQQTDSSKKEKKQKNKSENPLKRKSSKKELKPLIIKKSKISSKQIRSNGYTIQKTEILDDPVDPQFFENGIDTNLESKFAFQRMNSQQDENQVDCYISQQQYQQQQLQQQQFQSNQQQLQQVQQQDKIINPKKKILKIKNDKLIFRNPKIKRSDFKSVRLQISNTPLPDYFLKKNNRKFGFHRICMVLDQSKEDPKFEHFILNYKSYRKTKK